jgi:hypothetical protein
LPRDASSRARSRRRPRYQWREDIDELSERVADTNKGVSGQGSNDPTTHAAPGPRAPSSETARRRALALSLVILSAAFLVGVGALLFPESVLARATPPALRSFMARGFTQQWRLFGPEVPAREASIRYRCGDGQSDNPWRDPEAADIAAARASRLRPENKAMHAPRVVAASLYHAWLERSASLCPDRATAEGAESCPPAAAAVQASQAFERAIELAAPRCKREGEARVALRLVVSDRSALRPVAPRAFEIDLGERSCPP